jgi:hypothetical protein
MRKLLLGAPLVLVAAGTLASCNISGSQAAAPQAESEQVIGNTLKELYMSASAAPPQSAEQRKLILRMADQSSNGKELLLTMRAAEGVFPTDAELQSVVATKMMRVATLDQMTNYAKQYAIPAESARPYLQRIFELGETQSDPRVWQRIRAAAARLKIADLEKQAQAKADQLATR